MLNQKKIKDGYLALAEVWLAVDKNSKKIICFEFGKIDDATFIKLKANLDKYKT